MPIPNLPSFATPVNSPCGGQNVELTLAAMITAFAAGTEKEKVQFRSQVVDLNSMTHAWDTSGYDSKEIFCNDTGIPTPLFPLNITSIVGNLPDPFLCVLTDLLLLPSVRPSGHTGVQLALDVDPTAATSTMEWKNATHGCTELNITLARDVMSDCNCDAFKLVIPGCFGHAPLEVWVPELKIPSTLHEGEFIHQGNAWQQIINMLTPLLENAGVCGETPGWTPLGNASGATKFEFPVRPAAVRLHVYANPNPARINWTPPEGGIGGGVQRYGKVVWLDENNYSAGVDFFNSQDQIFIPPVQAPFGMWVYLNDDVGAFAYWKKAIAQLDDPVPLTPSTQP